MAAILRPYARVIDADVGKQIPLISAAGQLGIDWKHPLSIGLIGAYLPGISWQDYTGINGPLGYVDAINTGACTGVPTATPEGPGFGNSANVKAALSTALGKLDPRIAKWTTKLSFYVRINQVGTGTAANGGIFFIQDTGGQVSIGVAPLTGTSATNTAFLWWGAFTNSVAGGATYAVGVHGLLGTINVTAGTSTLYVDGASYLTTTSVTAPTTTVANTAISLDGMPDAQILAVYFWDHVLTAAEALVLESEPYGIFQPPTIAYFPLAQAAAAQNYIDCNGSDSINFPALATRLYQRTSLLTSLVQTSQPVKALNYQMAATPTTSFFPVSFKDVPLARNYAVTLESTAHSVLPVRPQPAAQTPTFLFFSGIQEDVPRRADYRVALASTMQPVITLNYQMAATPTTGFDAALSDDRPMRADVIGNALRATTSPVQPRAPPTAATQTPSFWIQNPDCTLPDQV